MDVTEFYNWIYNYGKPVDGHKIRREVGFDADRTIQVPDDRRVGMSTIELDPKAPALTEAESRTARELNSIIKREDIVKRIRESYFMQMDRQSLEELAHELGLRLATDPAPELPLQDELKHVAERTVEAARGWLRERLSA